MTNYDRSWLVKLIIASWVGPPRNNPEENIYTYPNQIRVNGIFKGIKFAGKMVSSPAACKQNSGAGPRTIWRSQLEDRRVMKPDRFLGAKSRVKVDEKLLVRKLLYVWIAVPEYVGKHCFLSDPTLILHRSRPRLQVSPLASAGHARPGGGLR